MLKILIIDGQGGGIGKTLIEQISQQIPSVEIIAIGTNAVATSSMIKAGAVAGATGENAVIYNCGNADVIIGPIGIILANSMLGEISPNIANAISQSKAYKILIPVSKCHTRIVGVLEKPLSRYVEDVIQALKNLLDG